MDWLICRNLKPNLEFRRNEYFKARFCCLLSSEYG